MAKITGNDAECILALQVGGEKLSEEFLLLCTDGADKDGNDSDVFPIPQDVREKYLHM